MRPTLLHSRDQLYMIEKLLNRTIGLYHGYLLMFYGDILIVVHVPELPSLSCSPGLF